MQFVGEAEEGPAEFLSVDGLTLSEFLELEVDVEVGVEVLGCEGVLCVVEEG